MSFYHDHLMLISVGCMNVINTHVNRKLSTASWKCCTFCFVRSMQHKCMHKLHQMLRQHSSLDVAIAPNRSIHIEWKMQSTISKRQCCRREWPAKITDKVIFWSSLSIRWAYTWTSKSVRVGSLLMASLFNRRWSTFFVRVPQRVET